MIEIPPGATPLQYEELEKRYYRLDKAILGLSVTQMILWFPLGFLYFIGLTPRRGRLHMGMGILFFLLSMAGIIALISQGWSCFAYGPTTICVVDVNSELIAFLFVAYLAIASASIGVGANHRHVENLLRAINNGRFVTTFGDRLKGEPPFLHA